MSEVSSATLSSPTSARCAFCGHANPPGAKYCNECAADLQLTLCERCSAVNRRGTPQCHKCGAPVADLQPPADLPEMIAAPSAAPSLPPRKRRPVLALAVLVLVAIVAALYSVNRIEHDTPIEVHSAAVPPPQALPATPTPQSEAMPSPPESAEAPRADASTVPGAVEAASSAAPQAPPQTPPVPAQALPVPEQAPPVPQQAPPVPQQAPPEPPVQEAANACPDAVAALSLCERSRPK